MPKIIVLGGTGYAGAAIVAEAARRGHEVVAVSRSVPETTADGVTYVQGSVADAAFAESVVAGAHTVVSALSPRGDLDGRIVDVDTQLARLADEAGARFVVVGGFGSLRPEEGAARIVESPDFPADYRPESQQMLEVLEVLRGIDDLDWVYVSPAQEFGSFNPGEDTGSYRVGGEIAFFDADGRSAISGADFARGVVDEVENPQHHKAHISLAY